MNSTIIYIPESLIRESSSFELLTINPLIISFLIPMLLLGLYLFIFKKLYQRILTTVGILICASYGLASRYIMPQDDLYSNFLTAYNYSKYKMLSLSKYSMIEGTVESFFYGMVGIFSGANRAEILYNSVYLSMLFGLGILFLIFLIIDKIFDRITSITILFFILYSQYYVYNLYSGYGYNLFLFVMLLSFYLLISERKLIGFILLALLVLIRPEGAIFYCMFSFFYHLNQILLKDLNIKKSFKKYFFVHIFFILVTILSLIIRYKLYGHFYPPVAASKATDFPHWPAITYALKKLGATMFIPVVGLISISSLLVIRKERIIIRKYYKYWPFLLSMVGLGAAYKIHGGDFLFMNRYDFLVYIVVIFMLSVMVSIYVKSSSTEFVKLLVTLLFLVNYLSDYSPVSYLLKQSKKTVFLEKSYFSNIGAPYKEGLSIFINKSFSNSVKRIGVVEVNTFGYFSDHKIYDMFGTTNKDIANQSPTPRMDLFPGYKKRNPRLLEKYNLDFIVGRIQENSGLGYYNDLIEREVVVGHDFGWGESAQNYELGGIRYLKELGYHPVLIVFDNISFSFFMTNASLTELLKNNPNHKTLKKKYKLPEIDRELDII